MKNRLIALFLTTVLILAPFAVFPVQAESNAAPCDETVERVKNEVLTGNITNTQDVLDVAMAQRSAENAVTPVTNRMRSTSSADDVEESLKISQVIDATENEDGSYSGTLAVTGLLLVDGSGRSVSANEYEYYHMNSNTEEGNLDNYNIYATQTIYITFCYYDSDLGCATLQLDHMTTTLVYKGTQRATKMRQIYADEADYYGIDSIIEYQNWITNPSARSYPFTPTQSRPLPIGPTQIQGQAEIQYGDTTMYIVTILPTDSFQFNIDFGILEEGW